MKKKDIVKLLQDYKQGTLSEEEAAAKIAEVPFEEMQFAEIDHHRELRQGIKQAPAICPPQHGKEASRAGMHRLC